MGERIDELFDETINLIKRYGNCLLRDPDCNIEDEWPNIAPCMKYVCDEYLIQDKTFETLYKYMAEVETNCVLLYDVIDENVVDKFNAYVQQLLSYMKLGEENKMFKEFKNTMFSRVPRKNEDSDITTVAENVKLVDPITKLRLTDPVRNKVCGHVYERATIYHLLRTKKKLKCPIPGCVAAAKINKADLKPDVALKKYLATHT